MTTANDERTDERSIGAYEQLARQLEEVAANVGSVLYGKRDVVRLTRQIAYAEATISSDDAKLISRSTGTFLVHRSTST